MLMRMLMAMLFVCRGRSLVFVSCEQEEPIKKKRQSLPAYLIYFFESVSFSIDRLALS